MVTHWAAKGQLCWEGGPLGPGTCWAPSPAPPEQGNGTEVALPAAFRGSTGGTEQGSPGLGACTSSSGGGNVWLQPDLGPGWGFWCVVPFFLWDGMWDGRGTALPLL